MMAANCNWGKWDWRLAVIFAGCALLAAGCQRNNYAIRLTPQDGKLQRELKFVRTSTDRKAPVPRSAQPEELAALAKAYGKPLPENGEKTHQFSIAYRGKSPDDVGNTGWYLRFESPLGAVHGYVEEFRGTEDWNAELQTRLASLDRVADHLSAWLKTELADDPNWTTLETFLNTKFRSDLRNLGLFVFAHSIHLDEETRENDQLFVQFGQYLARRGYFEPEQIPLWVRAIEDTEREKFDRICSLAKALVEKRLGYDKGKVPAASLDFLANPEAMQKSLDNYLKSTKNFTELVKAWEEKKKTEPTASEPTPQDVLGDFLMEAFLPGFRFESADRLGVELVASQKPFSTNGKWDQGSKTVSWTRQIPPREHSGHERPQLLFALWSEPAEEAQRMRFGRTLLNDDQLAEYCVWYQGLTAAEQKEWDNFVSELKPTINLMDRLDRFHFANEPDAEPGTPAHQSQLANTPRKLLKEKLMPENNNETP